jgi:hypothetical protein
MNNNTEHQIDPQSEQSVEEETPETPEKCESIFLQSVIPTVDQD